MPGDNRVQDDVLDEKMDDVAATASACEVGAGPGDRCTNDPEELGPRVREVSTPLEGAIGTSVRGAADEKDERSRRESVEIVLEDLVVEEPFDGAVGNIEEFVSVIDNVFKEGVATSGVVLEEDREVVLWEGREPCEA